jgi:mannose-6-phosphate isomerase
MSSPRVVHTLEAVKDAEIIEVSTPQLDDVVRLEDRYGRMSDTAP